MTRTVRGARAPRVLVTDAARGSAVAVIRSLGRRGWYVIAAASEAGSPGFKSRYAAAPVRYRDPRRDPDAMLERLRHTIRQHAIDIVVPVTEDVALPLSRARGSVGDVTLALPEAEAFETARDKGRTVALAVELGIPVPRTATLTANDPAPRLQDGMSWPVVIKPIASRAVVDGILRPLEVDYARDATELVHKLANLPDVPVLVQEFWAGHGVGVEVLAEHGRVIEAFQHRRLHEVPLSGGASAYRESVPLDPTLLRHTEMLMEALAWTGLAMVEFKVGPAGARLMEINPRIWGSLPLSVAAGVDFPGRMAALHLGMPQPVQGRTAYRVGVRARNLTLDLHWAAAVLVGRDGPLLGPRPSRLAALRGLAAAVLQPTRSDMFAVDDIGPQLAELARLAGRIKDLSRAWRS